MRGCEVKSTLALMGLFLGLAAALCGCDDGRVSPGTDGGPSSGADAGAGGGDAGSTVDAGPAGFASRDRVVVTWAAGGVPPGANRYLAPPSDSFEAFVEAQGLTLESGPEWPSDPDGVRVLLWVMPYANEAEPALPSAADVERVTAYLSGGGRLVVVGDRGFSAIDGYSGFQSQDGVDALLEQLGVGVRLAEESLPDQLPCGAPSHPLAVASLSQPAGESLEVIEPATWLSCSGAAYQAHSGGEVIVVGDSQTFFTGSNDDFSSKVLTVPPS